MKLRSAAVGVALAFAQAAAVYAQTPPICVARAALEPATAVVGQQVLWRVEIEMRDDVQEVSWVDPPAFAHIRTERLPGLPATAATTPDGRRTLTRVEQRALFAERAGALRIESGGLRCRLGDGPWISVPIPAIELEVTALPEPASTHLVGPLVLGASVEPMQLALGESVEVTVSVRGAGNLWDVEDPLPRPDPDGPTAPEVFARPSQLDLRRGVRLSVQQIFRYDVVPRATGSLAIPAIAIRYYDPRAHAYAVAESAEQIVEVRAPQTPESSAATAPSESGPETPEDRGFGNAVFLAIALALGLAGIWAWRRPRPTASDEKAALAAAARAAAEGDAEREAAELTRAIRAALASRVDAPLSDAAEMLSRNDLEPAVASALEVLVDLERSRFDPRAAPPQRGAAESAIRNLRKRGS